MPSFRVSARIFRQAVVVLSLLSLPFAGSTGQIATSPTAPITLARQDVTGFSLPYTVAMGDLNGDGKPDLVVGNQDPVGTVEILVNMGSSGTLTSLGSPFTFQTGAPVNQIVLADLNGDGRLDIVVAHNGGVTIFTNATAPGLPTINLNPPTTVPTPPGAAALSVAAADLNGDGQTDLVVGFNGSSGPSAMAFRNQSSPFGLSFDPGTSLPLIGPVPAIAAVDVNGDGRLDIVMANGIGVAVALNTATVVGSPFSFSSPVPFMTGTSRTPTSIAAGDLNGDGKPDLVVGQGNSFAVLTNMMSPGGSPAFAPFALTSAPMGADFVGVADMNGDGRLDVVTLSAAGGGVAGWPNVTSPGSSTVAFGSPSQFAAPVSKGFVIADVNGDGRPDVILAQTSTNSVGILYNTTGAADHLAFGTQPSSAQAGASISPAVTVTVQDALGNPVTTATNPVTVALGANPDGATLSGTLTMNAVNGVATFGNLSLDKVGTGYTLAASSAGLAGATSGSFSVSAGAPAQLVIATQPSNTQVGASISPAVTVAIQDAFGNATQATSSVTIALAANPGGATLSGTTTANAVNGVASFGNLSLDKVGTGYTLVASSSGLTATISFPFTVAAALPPHIVKSFGSATIPFNGTTTLFFTIDNPNQNTTLTGITFIDALPAGLQVASTPGLINGCGGTVTADAGSISVTLSGGTLAPGAVCHVSVLVQGKTPGVKNNSVTVSDTSVGVGNTSTASVTVGIAPPVIVKDFSRHIIRLNGTTSLSFMIRNPNPSTEINAVSFTDTLPQGLVVAAPSGLSIAFGDCGGTITATPGTFIVSLAAATLGPGASCGFSVNITGVTPGKKTNQVTVSSAVGAGNTSTATLAVVEPATVIKAFGAKQIPLNGTTSLRFTIINNDLSTPLTDIYLLDFLPSGMRISAPDNGLTQTCSGTVVADPGGHDLGLVGASLDPATSCTFSVNVTATSAGILVNTTDPLSSFFGALEIGDPASASIQVVAPPTIRKAFNPTSIPLNGITLVTFNLTNPNTNLTLTGVAFNDSLPSGLAVATPNGQNGTCGGGTINALAGSNTISLSGATLLPGGSCTFSVNVTGEGMGMKNNSVTVTSANGGSGNLATASITVVAPPIIAKAFNPATIMLNTTSSLIFTIANPAGNPVDLTGVAFTDTLPAGLTVASTPNTSNTCGGTTIAAAGSRSVSLSGGTLAPGASCTASVTVKGTTVGVANNSVIVTSTNGGTGNFATASITVTKVPTVTLIHSSPDPSIVGSPATFTAQVIPEVTGTPTGTVTFKDGNTALGTVPLNASGTVTFTTSSLGPGSHSITATYSGDGNFDGSTSRTLTQNVTYEIVALYDQAQVKNSGATIPIKVVLMGGNSQNLSSPNIVLHVTGVFDASGNPVPGQISNANPNGDFRFDAGLAQNGGGYIFNLSTKGLPPGTYTVHFTIPGDPITHLVTFTVK
jgi:hypothetical protein